MHVMILNSGYARRLRPLTDKTHKSLLKIGSECILERQLRILSSRGLKDYIITTGPFADQIKQLVQDKFPELRVQYVNNPLFATTNYIYSMWLTRDLIHDDVLLLHGDLVFEPDVVDIILKDSPNQNQVIVDSIAEIPEKDFKGWLEDGRITRIGIDILGSNAIFLLPLYKWSKRGFLDWMAEIDRFITEKQVNCYAENAFNEISDELNLFPLDISGKFCMEVDTKEDLNIVRKIIKEQYLLKKHE